jgi:hypothetical protein
VPSGSQVVRPVDIHWIDRGIVGALHEIPAEARHAILGNGINVYTVVSAGTVAARQRAPRWKMPVLQSLALIGALLVPSEIAVSVKPAARDFYAGVSHPLFEAMTPGVSAPYFRHYASPETVSPFS